jgi:hypothetical protein
MLSLMTKVAIFPGRRVGEGVYRDEWHCGVVVRDTRSIKALDAGTDGALSIEA